jgi:hypothetical protein
MRHALALPAALALLALACGGAPLARSEPEPATPHPRRVLLFPLNVVGVELPSEVEAGADAVARELRGYLEGRGLAVEVLELGPAREAWLRAAMARKAEVGSEGLSLEGAASTLARQLSETHEFDALLLPWIAIQAARLKGGVVAWDGVKRKLEVVAEGRNKRARWVLGRLELWVKAPSLHVLGFSPEGEKLFEGVGGLDLVDDAQLDLSASKIRFDMTPKAQIFQDPARLREGIAIALEPLLPRSGGEAE